MQWRDHSKLKGKHALFSPSQPGYLKLSEEEFKSRLVSKEKAGLGTEIHDWCFTRITRRHKISSIKELVKSIDEFIFNKYYLPEYGIITLEGRRLLSALPYVGTETFNTIKSYVNDAISFRMDPEIVLLYSERFFGTADSVAVTSDAIRIHDLKTGSTPAKIEQLLLYDAYLCHEYSIDPRSVELHELRIYQNDDILIGTPTGEDVMAVLEQLKRFDEIQRQFEEV